jgi:serine/threonine protein phosphatase PrpC
MENAQETKKCDNENNPFKEPTDICTYRRYLDSNSSNSKATVYAAQCRGKHEYMEDRYSISTFTIDNDFFLLAAVMDGHGGDQAAENTKHLFADTVNNRMKQFYNSSLKISQINKYVSDIMKYTFYICDRSVEDESGTTLSCILVRKKNNTWDHMWVANVGDSCVYSIANPHDTPEKLTELHIYDKSPTEQKRFRTQTQVQANNKGRIEVCDKGEKITLAMTRAIGDITFGPAISAEPYTAEHKLKHNYIVLATDGIWDYDQNAKQVQNILYKTKRDKARTILETFNNQYEMEDNATIVVIKFNL